MVKFISIIPLLTLAPSLASASLLHRESQTSKNNHSNEEEVASSPPNDHRVMIEKAVSEMYQRLSTQHADRKMINRKLQFGELDEQCISEVLDIMDELGEQFFNPFGGEPDCISDFFARIIRCKFNEEHVEEQKEMCDDVGGAFFLSKLTSSCRSDGANDIDATIRNIPTCMGTSCDRDSFLAFLSDNQETDDGDPDCAGQGLFSVDNGEDMDDPFGLGSLECADFFHNDIRSDAFLNRLFEGGNGGLPPGDCNVVDGALKCDWSMFIPEDTAMCEELGGETSILTATETCAGADGSHIVINNMPACRGKGCDLDLMLEWMEVYYEIQLNGCPKTFKRAKKAKKAKKVKAPNELKTLKAPKGSKAPKAPKAPKGSKAPKE